MIAAPLLICGIISAVVFGIAAGIASDISSWAWTHFFGIVAMLGLAAVFVALFIGSLAEGWFA